MAAEPGGGRRAALVLASRSPQRRAILELLGVDFEVRPVAVAELDAGEPRAVALENARRKARAAERPPGAVVLAVDTLVALDGVIYGKPPDAAAAAATLRALSGATHHVFSGVALLHEDGAEQAAVADTAVTFRDLDPPTIAWYLESGEWRERAGGYAIQGRGAALVRAIEGDYANVVGLPLALLVDMWPALLRTNA